MNNMNIRREQDFEFGNNGFLLSLSHRELSFFLFFVESVDFFFSTSNEAHRPERFELWVMSLDLLQIHISEHLVVLMH